MAMVETKVYCGYTFYHVCLILILNSCSVLSWLAFSKSLPSRNDQLRCKLPLLMASSMDSVVSAPSRS